ncbi:unnamed protein product, partial [Musa acuminata subsp. malaccensis]
SDHVTCPISHHFRHLLLLWSRWRLIREGEIELGASPAELDGGSVVGHRRRLRGVEGAQPLAHRPPGVAYLRRPLPPRPLPHPTVLALLRVIPPPPPPPPGVSGSDSRGGGNLVVGGGEEVAAQAPGDAAEAAGVGERERGGGGSVAGEDVDECGNDGGCFLLSRGAGEGREGALRVGEAQHVAAPVPDLM